MVWFNNTEDSAGPYRRRSVYSTYSSTAGWRREGNDTIWRRNGVTMSSPNLGSHKPNKTKINWKKRITKRMVNKNV